MDEFLGTIEFNPEGDLLISSSYLTFQNWSGYVGYLKSQEVKSKISDFPLMLSSLNVNKSFSSGVCVARWCNENKILVGTERGEIYLINLEPDTEESKFTNIFQKHEHDSLILCLETKFDSPIALSGSEDSKIKIWDLNEQNSIRTLKAHDLAVCSLKFNPVDSNCFLSTSQDSRVLVWDTRKEKAATFLKTNLNGYASCASWSSLDLNQIALGSETGELGLYDLRMIKQAPIFVQKIHDRLVRDLSFNKSLNIISSASEDCTSKVFRIVPPSVTNEAGIQNIYTYRHSDYVTSIAWCPRNALEYLTCSWDGFVRSHMVNLKIQNGN